MTHLDASTLLALAFFVCVTAAALTLMAALYGKLNRTLLYASIGWFAEGGTGLVVNNAHLLPHGQMLTIWVSNVAMLLAYGFIWAGLRTFAGKTIPWFLVPVSAAVWPLLCLWPAFIESLTFRIIAFSILMLGYMLASLRDMWPSWRADKLGVLPVMFFLSMHTLFYVYRMIPHPAAGNVWLARTDMGLTVFENILFILGMSCSMIIMVRARAEQYYQHASRHDELTGIYNRRALFEQGSALFQQAMSTRRPLAALMCDLDRFKAINDQHGHNTGDKVLTRFAQHLQESTPDNAICARLGGEEFLILVPDVSSEVARNLAENIRNQLADVMHALPVACTVSIGIGIGVIADNDDDDLDRLVIRADQALYVAKEAGRNCTRTWSRDWQGIHTPNTQARHLQTPFTKPV